MKAAYIIYLMLCVFYGVISNIANIDLKDWKYWAILGCIVGAYICGRFT